MVNQQQQCEVVKEETASAMAASEINSAGIQVAMPDILSSTQPSMVDLNSTTVEAWNKELNKDML